MKIKENITKAEFPLEITGEVVHADVTGLTVEDLKLINEQIKHQLALLEKEPK